LSILNQISNFKNNTIMKELSIEKMEMVSGGISQRQCLANGIGTSVTFAAGFFFPPAWVASFVFGVNSVDCFK
jgi:hypothetical protein